MHEFTRFPPDGQDTLQIGNQIVRKGTLGAFIQNALALESPSIEHEEREAIIKDIREQVVALKATKALEVFEIRNSQVREIIEREF